MKITFYANACCVYECDGFRLLSDPWIIDGAFEGAWYHYPPLSTKPEDLKNVDALYLSHLHPDHFDPKTLPVFRRDIPIVILRREKNYLEKLLRKMKFSNILLIEDGASTTLGPFNLTMYGPFETHVFYDASIGYHIDSALVVDDGKHVVLNANDNRPSERSAHELKERHPNIMVAQLMYAGASPYPSCFNNLTDDEKLREHDGVVERSLAHMVKIAKILEPDFVMPFAGEFVLGGKGWRKNRFLGTTTPENAGQFAKIHGLSPLLLNEGMSFDLESGKTIGTYVPVDTFVRDRYIEEVISKERYPFEDDCLKDSSWFHEILPFARAHLWNAQQRYRYFPDLCLYLSVRDEYFVIDWEKEEGFFIKRNEFREPFITYSLPLTLLQRIMTRQAHWNNAELGCHVDFIRQPNKYLPDMHALISFFHA
ncbi:MAG: hypothetical protein COU07_03160 [Candidatus Harrisonbacteria bacterium CG10_big_fil_rev_8_21_14_0_10_40_38]|uniref:MBL fold metallo-hydrolase n=1 Tax=Candidatus Harrisonbacteria bacterium CG10_big_fil_rev_8_21_14_0_10_40_38 TaxID=1974583 RepID=A0A2H0URT0_9BACT|nr:MAG: hypothetical protein COU07_03160 [Candidatus Harrisonbacteria bacterium CG10_big_fil_rev_8_21_14_0_10_40_38]